MPAEFLKGLAVTAEERAKLATFGASNPKALLSIRKASKQVFDEYVGLDRADAIAQEIEKLLTDEERESLKTPFEGVGRFGARLDPLPKPKRPDS